MKYIILLTLFMSIPCNGIELTSNDCTPWFQGKPIQKKISFDSFSKKGASIALSLFKTLIDDAKPDQGFPDNTYWQANVILKGYLLRKQHDSARESLSYQEEFKAEFCSFWANNAFGPQKISEGHSTVSE